MSNVFHKNSDRFAANLLKAPLVVHPALRILDFLLRICILLSLSGCCLGNTTNISHFFVPNFSAATIGHYELEGDKIREKPPRIATEKQPASVAARKGSLFVANWGANKIMTYDLSSEKATVKSDQPTGSLGLEKPHHIILHPKLPILYVVHETIPGAVSVWQILQTGGLVLQQKIFPLGNMTSTLASSDDFRYMYASSPGDGKIFTFTVSSTGNLQPMPEISTGGTGPYSVIPLPTFSIMAAIRPASDDLVIFGWEATTGIIGTLQETVSLGVGASPRWLAYWKTQEKLVIVSSATGSLQFYDLRNRSLGIAETISGLNNPRSVTVSPDGKVILCSVDFGISVIGIKNDKPSVLYTADAGQLPLFGAFSHE